MTGYQYSRYSATKYLFCDIERRLNQDQVWTNCSVAVCAMDSRQNLISNSTEYILESALECEKFVKIWWIMKMDNTLHFQVYIWFYEKMKSLLNACSTH